MENISKPPRRKTSNPDIANEWDYIEEISFGLVNILFFKEEGFAEALDLLGEKSECKRHMVTVVNFNQSLLSPVLSPML